MTREDTKKMFKMIALAYPNFTVSEEMVDFWYEMLKDVKAVDIKYALKKHIKTKQVPPTIADLRRYDRSGGLPDAKELDETC